MTHAKTKALAGVAAAIGILGPGLLNPAAGLASSSAPVKPKVKAPLRLTRITAATIAHNDAVAAVAINPGDKVAISGCHAVAAGTFRCQVVVMPAGSASRPRWTDTIRLVKGKPVVSYSHLVSS